MEALRSLSGSEVEAAFKAWGDLEYERRRHVALSAALVAAQLVAVFTNKSVRPSDFLSTPVDKLPKLTGTTLASFAKQHNRMVH